MALTKRRNRLHASATPTLTGRWVCDVMAGSRSGAYDRAVGDPVTALALGAVSSLLRFRLPSRSLRWAIRTRGKYEGAVPGLIREYPDLIVVRLRSQQEVEERLSGPMALLPEASLEAPLDRGMIEAFVKRLTEGPVRPVVDAGCGTGRMTRLLASLGVAISGIDLSAGMIAVARLTSPELNFEVAGLSELPYADRQLGGVFAC